MLVFNTKELGKLTVDLLNNRVTFDNESVNRKAFRKSDSSLYFYKGGLEYNITLDGELFRLIEIKRTLLDSTLNDFNEFDDGD
jgi:hypothetical protein